MMRRTWAIFASAAVLAGVTGVAITRKLNAEPAPAKITPAAVPKEPAARISGTWQPPSGLTQIPIWPNGAPDQAGLPHLTEQTRTNDTPEAIGGSTSSGVYNVTAPTMTVYPPKGRNTGIAVVVFPGGGFQMLAITIEGTEICDWLSARGMTCILAKYRVPKTDTYGDSDCQCQITPKPLRALQDAQRTIRLVRARARELNVDPKKIGVMGFSAGGYLVAQTSNIFEPAYTRVDAIDKISSRPDFAVALYPGHLCRRGGMFAPGVRVTKQTPPTFLLQNWDDPVDDICNSTMYARALQQAGVPSEVHLFMKGGHAFALRGKNHPVAMWPSLVESWLNEIGMM